MTESIQMKEQKDFIQRQAQFLSQAAASQDDLSAAEILEKSLSILKDPKLTQAAQEQLKESESLIKTYQSIGVIDLDPEMIQALQAKQGELGDQGLSHLEPILKSKHWVTDVFNLLKTRLKTAMDYAIFLASVAAMVAGIISAKVLHMFEEVFASFNAALPAPTLFILAWNNSFLPPSLLMLLLVLLLLFIKREVIALSKTSVVKKRHHWIPFIGQVIHFTRYIESLNYLKLLRDTGYSYQQAYQLLASLYQDPIDQETRQQLETAEANACLSQELDYQIKQSYLNAEVIVSRAARKLSLSVMAVVASFIALFVYASYLPIFQLGNVQ